MNTFHKFLTLSALSFSLITLNGTPALGATIPSNAPEIQYFGRWDSDKEVYRCGFGATYIKANFTGTSLKAHLKGSGIWWRVSIDGGEFRRFEAKGKSTLLAENLPPGEHKVLLVRSTEGQAGISEFRGFTVDNGASLTAPDPMKKRRLEFVGDSITAGAFNDGHWTGHGNFNAFEDNDMAFGPQLARMLHADYSVIAKSGQGVVQNYTEKWPYQGVHTKDSYAWTFFFNNFSPKHPEWDTKKFPVDAVILSIGTNDFNDQPYPPTAVEFKEGYRKLIEVLRKKNPHKPIICTDPVPSVINPESREWIHETVRKFRLLGDKEVYFISFHEKEPLLEKEDYVDGSIHPTKTGSTKLANYLKDKVASILGW